MHPSEEIRFERGAKLKDKKICLCLTGSVACVESFYLCRDLIRYGAEVDVFMTESSTRLMHPDLMEFASGRKPILELTGGTEHITLCSDCDLVIVSPCTANTVSKIALGIADNPVTTCVTTALGSGIPVIVVPAMHLSLMRNKAVKKNIEELERLGCKVLKPRIEGNRAKIADRETIIASAIRLVGKKDLEGKSVLIIGGASAEKIDEIRVLTNRSSGKFSIELAREAFERGADVELWHGWIKEKIPPYIKTRDFESVNDLLDMIKDIKRFDFIVVCAALSNYVPRSIEGKIPSGIKGLTVDMDTAPNILNEISKLCGGERIVAFKAEERESELLDECKDLSKKYRIVVGNLLTSFGKDKTTIWIFEKGKMKKVSGNKRELARYIVDAMVS